MREARVRQEYEKWYQGIDARVWHDAASLAETVLRRRRSEPSKPDRQLPEAQFEFRGSETLRGRPSFRRPTPFAVKGAAQTLRIAAVLAGFVCLILLTGFFLVR